jgi:hypothetical protein
MICVSADNAGVLSVVTPQPPDVSSCSMVVASPSELAGIVQPLDISSAEQIGAAIFLLFTVAFVFRAIRRIIESRIDDEGSL